MMAPGRRLRPLVSRVEARLGLGLDVKARATKSWVIAPAERTPAPAAIFDELDLERITGVGPDDTLQSQIARARGGVGEHTAAVAYELRNTVLADGHLFAARLCYPVGARKLPLFAGAAMPEFAEAALASSRYGIRYFGHWMADDLPRLLVARECGSPVSVLTNPTPAQTDYLDLLGLTVPVVANAFFRRIVVVDDAGQTTHKRMRFHRLQAMAKVFAPARPSAGVMLLRGDSGVQRILVNEAEMAAVAVARGFRVLTPRTASALELLQACAQAKVVLGVEGSQLTNGMMWMAPGGTVVAIQPPHRFVMVLKDWCDCIGLRYAFAVGHAAPDGAFRVDIDALQHMLDRVG